MKTTHFIVVMLIVTVSLPVVGLAEKDRFGDPLPEGAIQRLGTLRMRYSNTLQPGNRIADLGYLPDGKGVVAASNFVEIWDLSAGKLLFRQQICKAKIVSMSVRSDGKALLLADVDGNVHEWDIASRRVLRKWQTGQKQLMRAQYSPDLKRVLTVGCIPPTIKEWDIATGKELISITGEMEHFTNGIYGPEGKTAIVDSESGYKPIILRYDLSTGKLIHAWLRDYYTYWRDLALSPDGKRILIGSRTRATEWRLKDYKLLNTFTGHAGHAVSAVAYCKNPDQILTGCRDGSIRRWDRRKAKVLLRWIPHQTLVTHIAVSPDGKWVFSAGRNVVVESNIITGKPRFTWPRHSGAATAVAVLPGGVVAISASADGTMRKWEIISGKCLGTIKVKGATPGVYAVAVSPDGKRIAAGCKDGVIREYDTQKGTLIRQLKGHFGYVRCLVYTHDGKRLLSSADDGAVRIWPAEGEKPIAVLKGHRGGVLSVAVSSNDKYVLTGGRDATVRLWDLKKAKLIKTYTGHRGWVEAVAFIGDSKYGISAGGDGRILKWDLRKGKILSEMNHGKWVYALACTADGKIAFAAGQDGTITCWDLIKTKQITHFSGHAGNILDLAITPDGKHLISAGEDTTLLVWKVPSR